jgi:hypothetical protein
MEPSLIHRPKKKRKDLAEDTANLMVIKITIKKELSEAIK